MFLKKKFAATDRETNVRPAMGPLPPRNPTNIVNQIEFDKEVNGMSKHKATGPDGIPIEVFKASAAAKAMLKELISRMWVEEEVPESFGRAVFVMLFKNKGSSNDPSKYRCIGLLNHSYKVLSSILLGRIQAETDKNFLKDWQAGFRKHRGCRDNILILKTLVDHILDQGEQIALTFVDYKAAFDSVSHKFIDSALRRAKVKPKTRAMFRAIYRAASAVTKVAGPDGEDVVSEAFPVRRGVVQGDVTSPLYFILALEAILQDYDKHPNKGVRLGETLIHTLAYADDAALVDKDARTATERITAIAQGSAEATDMIISIDKTEVMHVRDQGALGKIDKDKARAECKHKCSHLGCRKTFATKHGLAVHKGKCKWSRWCEVEKLLAVQCEQDAGAPIGHGTASFLVRWKGYGAKKDEWVDYANITPELIQEYLVEQGLYDFNWPHRCQICDKPASSERGIKVHQRRKDNNCRKYLWDDNEQNFTGTVAERKAQKTQREEEQKSREVVKCGRHELKNVFTFKYLGSLFAADGSQEHDIQRRIAIATTRAGQLRHVFNDKNLDLKTKLRLYKAAIVSLFTYGCEAWTLAPRTMRQLNGANARLLSRFTGKSCREEARDPSFNLVRSVRGRRLCWLGTSCAWITSGW